MRFEYTTLQIGPARMHLLTPAYWSTIFELLQVGMAKIDTLMVNNQIAAGNVQAPVLQKSILTVKLMQITGPQWKELKSASDRIQFTRKYDTRHRKVPCLSKTDQENVALALQGFMQAAYDRMDWTNYVKSKKSQA
jgi:hypothetical protein